MRFPLQVLPSLKLIAKAPENRPKPNRRVVFQPSIFRGYVSFREGNLFKFHTWEWLNLLVDLIPLQASPRKSETNHLWRLTLARSIRLIIQRLRMKHSSLREYISFISIFFSTPFARSPMAAQLISADRTSVLADAKGCWNFMKFHCESQLISPFKASNHWNVRMIYMKGCLSWYRRSEIL